MAAFTRSRRGGRSVPMGVRAADVARGKRGRTGPATTPVYIRGAIDADGTLDRDFIRARLGDKLGKYALRIDRLDVSLATNAPAHGRPRQRIIIEAGVSRGGPVAVTGTGTTARSAFLAASRAAERSIRRRIERRRQARPGQRAKRS